MEEEHSQALDSSASRAALVRKELETLQQETDKLRSVGLPLIRTAFLFILYSLTVVFNVMFLICTLILL